MSEVKTIDVPAGTSWTLRVMVHPDGSQSLTIQIGDAPTSSVSLQGSVQQTGVETLPDCYFYSIARLGEQIPSPNYATRVLGAFRRLGINYIGELLQFTPRDLLQVRNMGKKTVQAIVDALQKLGLRLSTPVNQTLLIACLERRGMQLTYNIPISNRRDDKHWFWIDHYRFIPREE